MKPQNYSLKFQNSLADSRITPGSQPGKGPASNAPRARNGQRAVRRLTKYQQSVANNKVGKASRSVKCKVDIVEAEVSNDAWDYEKAGARAVQEALRVKKIGPLKGILKKPKQACLAEVPMAEKAEDGIKKTVAVSKSND